MNNDMDAGDNEIQESNTESADKRFIVFLSIVSSILFTLALAFLTFTLPYVITAMIMGDSADFHNWTPEAQAIISSLSWIGLLILILTISLIIVGIVLSKKNITRLGALSMWLPTFGYFSATMFALAGIGILRVPWISMMFLSDSLVILELGHIVLLPYFVLVPLLFVIPFAIIILMGLPILTMLIGLFIFTSSVAIWFYGRYSGVDISDTLTYRHSRHPQYLGFLIWSYGLLLFIPMMPIPMGAYTVTPSFPWMIAALALIGSALIEEQNMLKQHGDQYQEYLDHTNFLLPLPKIFSDIILKPIRLFLKKDRPETKTETGYVLILYGIILILLSIPVAIFSFF